MRYIRLYLEATLQFLFWSKLFPRIYIELQKQDLRSPNCIRVMLDGILLHVKNPQQRHTNGTLYRQNQQACFFIIYDEYHVMLFSAVPKEGACGNLVQTSWCFLAVAPPIGINVYFYVFTSYKNKTFEYTWKINWYMEI